MSFLPMHHHTPALVPCPGTVLQVVMAILCVRTGCRVRYHSQRGQGVTADGRLVSPHWDLIYNRTSGQKLASKPY